MISASRHTPGMSTVRVWHMVTVAFFFWSIMETGFPMTRLRPMTTARLPVRATP